VRADAAALVAVKRREYVRLCGPSFRIEASITALVRRLCRAGMRLAIVSGAARVEIEAVLRRSRLRSCFEVVIAAEDVRRCKPSPEGYKRAIKMMRARPATSLAIEDSPGGIAAARAAGLAVIGVATSYPIRVLRRAGARHIVRSLAGVDAAGLIRPAPVPRRHAARPTRATASRR
jgi:beta-phosphoglucomutase-like phosphatase (HAD superfamily)